MNIFVLDLSPVTCAKMHCDKHVVKMILEYTQLLNNTLPEPLRFYKTTHYNHPCSRWTRSMLKHRMWLLELALNLNAEYTYRYDKQHKCATYLYAMQELWQGDRYKWNGSPPQRFELCMPEKYITEDADPVRSYRNYYINDKAGFATWKEPAQQPEWFQPH